MITLTTRKEIVEAKKIIGSELTEMQKAVFDEDILQYYKDDNEEHLYREMFDFFEHKLCEYKAFYKVISLEYSDIITFTKVLTGKLIELFNLLDVKEFYIISHLKLDFFGNRDNKFKPLVKSYKQLEKVVGQKTYKEAFAFELVDLSNFIEVLFWLTRCDPSIAEFIFLFDKSEKVQIRLCKYGNVHLAEYGNEQLTDDLLISLGWTIIDGQEFDNFSVDGKIEGRRIKL